MSNQKLLLAMRQLINGIREEAEFQKQKHRTPDMMSFCDGTIVTCETILESLEEMERDPYLNS